MLRRERHRAVAVCLAGETRGLLRPSTLQLLAQHFWHNPHKHIQRTRPRLTHQTSRWGTQPPAAGNVADAATAACFTAPPPTSHHTTKKCEVEQQKECASMCASCHALPQDTRAPRRACATYRVSITDRTLTIGSGAQALAEHSAPKHSSKVALFFLSSCLALMCSCRPPSLVVPENVCVRGGAVAAVKAHVREGAGVATRA